MKALTRFVFFFLICCFRDSQAIVKLPRLISNGMVLQQLSKVKVWGWGAPAEKVSVTFNGQVYDTTTGADGKWITIIATPKAGGPYEMKIKGENELLVTNILVGEVWLCSGQSNMVLPLERVKEKYADVIAATNNPQIHHFFIPTRFDFNAPLDDFQSGRWETATPENILRFSATAYFFAKDIFEKYNVPVGLINASVGGTPVDAWISEDGLREFPGSLALLNQVKDSSYVNRIRRQENAVSREWYTRLRRNDEGMNGPVKWFEADFDASEWKTMSLPDFWDNQGLQNTNGVVWFRKEIEVPASMAGKAARFFMGRIVDSDSAYVNGRFVGTIGYQYPPRRYQIPEGLLKPGKNIIVARVINTSGRGGFIKDKNYEIRTADASINLAGLWQYKLGTRQEPLADVTFFQYKPAGLYNAMISPIINYGIKGVIWYQGESNTSNPLGYKSVFSTLITNWRQKWNQGDFPFIYVQLANFMETKSQPTQSQWAQLREEQRLALGVTNTAMAVAIDAGEWNDIHPLDKQTIGKRLALAARKLAYGEQKLVSSGPLYQSMQIRKNKIVLSFSHTGSGLMAKGEPQLKHFAIAGADKKYVWANARIKGHKIIVWSHEVKQPLAVRYAWADNPASANLYNKEGLPASPFSTDLN
ncbi:sialate O-acetylesterase [Emticicia fluvialis]|uniref:sialate O-acetylesterase n=1 Tax=Emticicia fluvialis TaxID=2974474 RepID=UPI002166AF4D|nr:sialate O-acetylesterase [Emticicia fluvialis]